MAEMKVGSKRSMRIVLRDLPNEALCYVASFLPAPSKALLAIALRRDENASIVHTGNAIIRGEQWDTLDFGDVEKSLASKITEELMQELLQYIGAKSKVKKLKLTGCINITGFGLSPLRASAVLEQIDLSLVAKPKVMSWSLIWVSYLVTLFCAFLIASLGEMTVRCVRSYSPRGGAVVEEET